MDDLVTVFKGALQHDGDYPIDFDRAWQWVGYSDKRHGFDALRSNFIEGEDFSLSKAKSTGGRRADVIRLSADCFKAFCMMAGTDKGKEVRRYFIEAEKTLRVLLNNRAVQKIVRRELTDALRDSGESDRTHGHAYSIYTDLIYRAVLGMDSKHFRETYKLDKSTVIRDHLTVAQAAQVRKFEDLARSMVEIGVPYEQIKTTIETMAVRKIEAA